MRASSFCTENKKRQPAHLEEMTVEDMEILLFSETSEELGGESAEKLVQDKPTCEFSREFFVTKAFRVCNHSLDSVSIILAWLKLVRKLSHTIFTNCSDKRKVCQTQLLRMSYFLISQIIMPVIRAAKQNCERSRVLNNQTTFSLVQLLSISFKIHFFSCETVFESFCCKVQARHSKNSSVFAELKCEN